MKTAKFFFSLLIASVLLSTVACSSDDSGQAPPIDTNGHGVEVCIVFAPKDMGDQGYADRVLAGMFQFDQQLSPADYDRVLLRYVTPSDNETTNVYGNRDDLQTLFRCDALAVEPSTGNAAMTWFLDQTIVYKSGHQITSSEFWPEKIRNKGDWGTYRNSTKNVIEHAVYVYKNSSSDNAGYKMCFPIIICQKAVK